MSETSVKTYSRAVGVFPVLTIVGGYFGEAYVPSLMMTGDAATTAAQLRRVSPWLKLRKQLVKAARTAVRTWRARPA
jgi:hypothetical protein